MSIDISKTITRLIEENGLAKLMQPSVSPSSKKPSFFLLRKFIGLNDLLIIFHSKKCKYKCNFCNLNNYNSDFFIPSSDLLEQFIYVVSEVKHSLHLIDCITFSNNGSVLDESTFPFETLVEIVKSLKRIKSLKKIVLETRFEFISQNKLNILSKVNNNVKFDLLVGFETLDNNIRTKILGKNESFHTIRKSLDIINKLDAMVTAYILFKPSPFMDDKEAFEEAERTFKFLKYECNVVRAIPLIIRVNPVYASINTPWGKMAMSYGKYLPPKITDILRFARKILQSGIPAYIGLSDEGLSDFSYKCREDYNRKVIRDIFRMNTSKIKL